MNIPSDLLHGDGFGGALLGAGAAAIAVFGPRKEGHVIIVQVDAVVRALVYAQPTAGALVVIDNGPLVAWLSHSYSSFSYSSYPGFAKIPNYL
jgi:hypothetical protein